ncbi:MAG: sel1 repeat family protein [Idiomarina sp.]|nr:sel1 repeat family protein [Idiomarina sp.]
MATIKAAIQLSAFIFAAQITMVQAQPEQQPSFAELEESDLICADQSCRNDLRLLHRLARFGSLDANTVVGVAYVTGDGLEQNVKHGIGRLKISVRYGHAPAMLVLSDWYANGYYVEQNTELAAEYLDQAVEAGYPIALYRRALVKLQQDDQEQVEHGITMLEDASDAHLTSAMFLLARLKYVGGLVEYDLVGATDLFRRLSLSGHEQAPAYLREIIAELQSADSTRIAELLADKEQTDRDIFIANLQDSLDIERIQVYGRRFDVDIESPLTIMAYQLDSSGSYMRGSAVRMRHQGCNERMGCIAIEPRSGQVSLNEAITGRPD